MTESIYQLLARIGYSHPLHPPATHLPAGLIIGGFLFALVAWIFNRKNVAQSARHCIILALIMAIPTILLGLMDWQQRFGGAYLFEIKMKLFLAGVLLFLLLVAVVYNALAADFTKINVVIYTLCLLTVIGLGYFGGELVYGTREPAAAETEDLAVTGEQLFKQNCSACHLTDSTATKLGPGLQGLFNNPKLPASGRPTSEENVRATIVNGQGKMPPFKHLDDSKMKALIDYLKSL